MNCPPPDERELLRQLALATEIQKFQALRREDGKQIRILELRWLENPNVICKIDPERGRVVTVLTPGMGEDGGGSR